MKIICAAGELETRGRPVSLAIGFFDGVHLGHQAVINRAVQAARELDGKSAVMTFDRHPSSIVAPERVPRLIYGLEQRLEAVASLGPDNLVLLKFDQALSQISGEEFVRNLARDMPGLRQISVGTNFFFGHRRTGNATLLKQLGRELGFELESVDPVSLDDAPISSTRIREAIAAGDFASADRMLGRPYVLEGKVITGDRLGHQLGFPTANLEVTGLVLPPNGVYAVRVNAEGKSFPGVLNIGFRPTVATGNPSLRVETHLLDFAGDLYGQTIGLRIEQSLRPEHKFASLEALKSQIALDIAEALKVLT